MYNWLANEEFAAEVERVRTAVVSGAIGRLRGAVEIAVGALVEVAGSQTAPEAARVAAAREILSRTGVVETQRVEVAGSGPSLADRIARRLGLSEPDASNEPEEVG